jgi:hypothetical protein
MFDGIFPQDSPVLVQDHEQDTLQLARSQPANQRTMNYIILQAKLLAKHTVIVSIMLGHSSKKRSNEFFF